MHADATADLDTLLAHEGFVRGLARRLVRDDDEADDVVQQTYVAALTHPPRGDERGLRGWFATVVRNVVRQRRRTDARRVRRERAVARPEGAPSTAELLARESARRTLVEAVLALDEPYRSAVVLRWFEGLAPREVAARLGVPVETARTRLKRAVAQLRERLDRRSGGERRAWLAAFAPLCAGEPAAAAPRPVGAWKVAAVAAGLGVVAVGGALLALRADTDATPPAAVTADAPPAAREVRDRAALATAPPRAAESARQVPADAAVRGHVVAAGRRLAAGARVTVAPAAPAGPASAARTALADARGRFVVDGLVPGAYRVVAESDDGARGEAVAAATRDDVWVPLFLSPPPPRTRTLWVRVLDPAGRPAAGAWVYAAWEAPRDATMAHTDERGLVRIVSSAAEPGPWSGWVTARGEGGVARRTFEIRPEPAGEPALVTLSLTPAGSIGGRLLPATFEGTPVVQAWAYGAGDPPRLDPYPSGEGQIKGGAYAIEDLAPGRYALTLWDESGRRLASRDDGAAVVIADVVAGTRIDVPLVVRDGAAVSGRVVRGADGAPVAGARVTLARRPGAGDAVPTLDGEGAADEYGAERAGSRALVTDGDGRYSAAGLAPGSWRVAVVAPADLALDVRDDVSLEEGRTASLEHALAAGSAIELLGEPEARFGLRVPGRETALASFRTPAAAGLAVVRVSGVPLGRYDVGTLEGARLGMVVATVDVQPGQTSFVDATRGGDVVLTGRVTRNGAALPGAIVTGIGPTDAVTGADGGYEFRAPVAARVTIQTVVTPPEPDGTALQFLSGCMTFGKEAIRRDYELPTGAAELAVTDADGGPAAGVLVSLRADLASFATLDGGAAVRSTDAQGVARWSGLPAGRYAATARFGGSGAVVRRGFAVEEGGVARAAAREPRSAALSVRVLDADGRPVRGALVTAKFLAREDDPGERDPARFARGVEMPAPAPTDAAGVTSVPGFADGVTLLTARRATDVPGVAADESAPEVVPVGSGATRTATLTLRKGQR